MPFPSKEQELVIKHRGKPLVVVAGPGTGKTRTIVERMIDLLNQDSERNITFVTYTRTSRADTNTKLTKAIDKTESQRTDWATPRVGTLHATAKSLVHKLGGRIGLNLDFTVLIYAKGERELIVEEVVADLNLGISPSDLSDALIYYLRTAQSSHLIGLSEKGFFTAFEYYEKLLHFYVSLGLDEIVYYAGNILEQSPDENPPIFLQVDEYQDLNPMDQRFVRLVASNTKSQVVVVGDDAQSIYGFRHANFKGLRDIWESKEWARAALSDCFRLPTHVQRASLALIAGQGYLGAAMTAKPDDGRKVSTFQCTKSEYQPVVTAHEILKFMKERKRIDGEPVRFKDIMILCPTAKFVPGVMEILAQFKIPTRKVSRIEIPAAVWNLILVLRIAVQGDNVAFRQWLDRTGLAPDSITAIRHSAMDAGRTLLDHAASSSDAEVKNILAGSANIRDAIDRIDDLAAAIARFPYIDMGASVIRDLLAMLQDEDGRLTSRTRWVGIFLERFGVLEDEDTTTDDDAVLVTSLHSAKGLEAELVCLMWMNGRYMPMPDRDEAEERRLLYVGMTRAKQDLIITFHEQYVPGGRYLRREAMSPFLHQIMDELAITRITKDDLSQPKSSE